MPLKIVSISNQRIKDVIHLQKANERKSQQLFVIEGQREIFLALQAGFKLKTLFFCDEIKVDWDEKYPIDLEAIDTEVILIGREVFEKVAYRENVSGLVAVAEAKYKSLTQLKLPDNPLIVLLESVEKPGNIGAILRTTDAANVDAVLICNAATDLFNPNTIRSSIGCVFTNQIVVCPNEEAKQFLHSKNIVVYTTYLEADYEYHRADFTKPSAIVMGSEANGVSDFWLRDSEKIKIPMNGKIDSINVSTAAAIIIFEARRQRNFK